MYAVETLEQLIHPDILVDQRQGDLLPITSTNDEQHQTVDQTCVGLENDQVEASIETLFICQFELSS